MSRLRTHYFRGVTFTNHDIQTNRFFLWLTLLGLIVQAVGWIVSSAMRCKWRWLSRLAGVLLPAILWGKAFMPMSRYLEPLKYSSLFGFAAGLVLFCWLVEGIVVNLVVAILIQLLFGGRRSRL